MLLKQIGFDKIIKRVVNKLGNVQLAYVTGDFALGIDNDIIDLLFVGDDLNKKYLLKLIEKTEGLIDRKIRYVIFGAEEFDVYKNRLSGSNALLLWKMEN
jgi:hypothetical protein